MSNNIDIIVKIEHQYKISSGYVGLSKQCETMKREEKTNNLFDKVKTQEKLQILVHRPTHFSRYE